MRIFYELA